MSQYYKAMAATEPVQASLIDEADYPVQRIRVETALSRFPIHRLAKDKREFSIDLERFTREGQVDFQWKTSFNSRYGPPGLLAYKLDTLLINRLIDEAPRPLPEYLRLGSLLEISRRFEMEESGSNTANIRRALMQSASTFIEASIKFRDKEGKENRLEIGGTRYSVILTGKDLPDGRRADAVYIVLNPWFRDLQEKVQVRPLDYNYLSLLPGAAQRLYELLSFPMYGALLNGRPCATLLYSEFCALCPITRHLSYDRMKKQMGKIHAEHHLNRYIIRPVVFEDATPAPKDGKISEPDWLMKYKPGPRAKKEFDTFMRRGTATTLILPPLQDPRKKKVDLASEAASAPTQRSFDLSVTPNSQSVATDLVARGVSVKVANTLVAEAKDLQLIVDQIEYADWVIAQGSINRPPGFYVSTIRDGFPIPDSFKTSRQRAEIARIQSEKVEADIERYALESAYADYQSAQIEAYISTLKETEYAELLDEARKHVSAQYKWLRGHNLNEVLARWVRSNLGTSGRVPMLSLKEFRHKQ